MQKTQNNVKKQSFSPNKDTVVDFVPGFILINHSGKLLKKCAMSSIEELLQMCKKDSRQYSAFMAFRCILSPNFSLKYGEASKFVGKLWSKATPTLKTEMARMSDLVKSKLKENPVFITLYNPDYKSSTADTTDTNSITTEYEDVFSTTDFEFSNDAYAGNVYYLPIDQNFFNDFPQYSNSISSGSVYYINDSNT